MNLLDRSRTIAPRGYNRWLVPPAALAVHLSIGQVYAFSVLKEPLIEIFDEDIDIELEELEIEKKIEELEKADTDENEPEK